MIDVNYIAYMARQQLFWNTPYRTGNLAMSVGDIGSRGAGSAGFQIFNANQRAPYGEILNEAAVINWRRVTRDGRTVTGSYQNKHYRWIDRAFEDFANQMPVLIPCRRV